MQLDFRWRPQEEDVGLFGKKGTGKTTRAKKILELVPSIPRLIWSPQKPTENYQGFGDAVTKISDLDRGAYIWNGDYNKENFKRFCARVMELKNMIVVIDDVHEYVTKQFMPFEFETIVLSARNRGISGIYLSPLPSLIPNQILGNLTHIFAFNFNLWSHIEWMQHNFFGSDAWLLIPKDRRDKFFIDSQDIDVLPKHSYLYRNSNDNYNQLVINGQVVNPHDLKPNPEDLQYAEPNPDNQSSSDSLPAERMPQEIRQSEESKYPSQNEARSELQDRDD